MKRFEELPDGWILLQKLFQRRGCLLSKTGSTIMCPGPIWRLSSLSSMFLAARSCLLEATQIAYFTGHLTVTKLQKADPGEYIRARKTCEILLPAMVPRKVSTFQNI